MWSKYIQGYTLFLRVEHYSREVPELCIFQGLRLRAHLSLAKHLLLNVCGDRGDRNFAPDNGPIYRVLGHTWNWAFRNGRFNLAKSAKKAASRGMIFFSSCSGLFACTVIAHGRTREWIAS